MIDEAFSPFHEIVSRIMSIPGEIVDRRAGVSSHVYEMTIETPVELDIVTEGEGALAIGLIPPLYRVDTTFQPSYHQIRFTARIDENTNGW
jgi:hypothetical protein